MTILDQSEWRKLDERHELAELHATYWGKKDKEDNQQMLKSDHSEDKHKDADAGGDADADVGGDADEDEDADEDADEDIIGCYILKINNSAIKMGSNSDGMLVRVSVLNCIQNGPLISQTG